MAVVSELTDPVGPDRHRSVCVQGEKESRDPHGLRAPHDSQGVPTAVLSGLANPVVLDRQRSIRVREYCTSEYFSIDYCTTECCSSEYCVFEDCATEVSASEYRTREDCTTENCTSEGCPKEKQGKRGGVKSHEALVGPVFSTTVGVSQWRSCQS